MVLTIFGMDGSPPCRAVYLVLKALGIDHEQKTVSMSDGDNRTPEFLRMNPAHTVPTMKDGDVAFGESHAIMGYLVDKYAPGHALYPRDPAARGRINSVLHYAGCSLFYAGLRSSVVVPLLFEKNLQKFNDSWPKTRESLQVLDGFLANSPYLAGPQPTLADLSVVTVVSTLDEAGFDLSFVPKTQAWLSKMKELPYYCVNEKGAKGLGSALRKAKEELESKQ